MPVKKDASGRRYVELEVEVPGTPEEVWRMIATGPGLSTWFTRTEVEEREGGALAFHMGPGMDSAGTVTGWEPPRRFAYEERDWLPNAPPIATECFVEARSGGTCIVRLVHSLFTSAEDWDEQLGSMESGWPWFFAVLQMALGDFKGQPSSAIRVDGGAAGSEAEAWTALLRSLGLERAVNGQPLESPGGLTPPLAGTIRRVGEGKQQHALLVALERPAPGAALFFAHSWGGPVSVSAVFFWFGSEAAGVAAREEPRWRAWVDQAPFAARSSAEKA